MAISMAKTIKEERLRWVKPIAEKRVKLVTDLGERESHCETKEKNFVPISCTGDWQKKVCVLAQ